MRWNPEEVEAAQQDADFKTFPRNYHIRKEDLIRHGYTARGVQDVWRLFKENEPENIRESAVKGLKTK